jgi:hypothetical protein
MWVPRVVAKKAALGQQTARGVGYEILGYRLEGADGETRFFPPDRESRIPHAVVQRTAFAKTDWLKVLHSQ